MLANQGARQDGKLDYGLLFVKKTTQRKRQPGYVAFRGDNLLQYVRSHSAHLVTVTRTLGGEGDRKEDSIMWKKSFCLYCLLCASKRILALGSHLRLLLVCSPCTKAFKITKREIQLDSTNVY